jgi:hypothetical protein
MRDSASAGGLAGRSKVTGEEGARRSADDFFIGLEIIDAIGKADWAGATYSKIGFEFPNDIRSTSSSFKDLRILVASSTATSTDCGLG